MRPPFQIIHHGEPHLWRRGLTTSSSWPLPPTGALRPALARAQQQAYASAPPPHKPAGTPLPPASTGAGPSSTPLARERAAASEAGARAGGVKDTLESIKLANARAFDALSPDEQAAALAKDKRGYLINLGLISAGLGLLAWSYFSPVRPHR